MNIYMYTCSGKRSTAQANDHFDDDDETCFLCSFFSEKETRKEKRIRKEVADGKMFSLVFALFT